MNKPRISFGLNSAVVGQSALLYCLGYASFEYAHRRILFEKELRRRNIALEAFLRSGSLCTNTVD